MNRVLSWFVMTTRLAVGGLLIAAAIPKMIDPAAFATTLAAYEWRGSWWMPAALVLPWLELLTGTALWAIPRLRGGAWLLGAMLFAMFAVAVASAVLRGLPIRCGCLPGLGHMPVGWPHVLADLALAAICAAGLAFDRHRSPAA